MAVALSAFGIRRARTLSLRSGLGILPETLAQGINLKLDTPAHAIERTTVMGPDETLKQFAGGKRKRQFPHDKNIWIKVIKERSAGKEPA
jgi:hypothetical protein